MFASVLVPIAIALPTGTPHTAAHFLIFPFIYGVMLYLLPDCEIFLIFFTILFLAETHFAATWPFFLNKANAKFIKENKVSLISFPLLIAASSLLGFILFKATFLLIFFCCQHVSRYKTKFWCMQIIYKRSSTNQISRNFYLYL